MRKMKGTKMVKRLLSVVLAIGMVLALIPMSNFEIVASAAGESALKSHYVGDKQVIRGVLDSITDLPQYNDPSWAGKKVGTAQRPFFILEIVPEESVGHFGYLVGGCEPIDIEHMFASNDIYNIPSISESCSIERANKAYFFSDEDEVKPAYNVGNNISGSKRTDEAGKTLKGYYEVVEDGKGHFTVNAEGTAIIAKPQGNLVWHTVNEFVKGYDKLSFNQSLANVTLSRIGDRIYTTRNEKEYYELNNQFMYYYNKEIFLTECIGLDENTASTYSVMIKTITPAELNQTPAWVDYADLLYVTPITHNGTIITAWNNHRRLTSHSTTITQDPQNGFGDKDITWNVTKKIFEKITAVDNYAAMILDNGMYGAFDKEMKSCTYKALNFNSDQAKDSWGKLATFQEGGYYSNLAKLVVMSVSVNPNIIKNIYLPYMSADRPNDASSKVKCSLQTGDAASYWGEHYFFMVDEAAMKLANTTPLSYWDKRDLYYIESKSDWENYNYLFNYKQDTVKAFVQGRVYTFKGNNALTQLFHSGTTDAVAEIFEDFEDYVKTDAETKDLWVKMGKTGELNSKTAPPSFAIRYILGLGKDYNKPTVGVMNVLDIVPSVGLDANSKPVWKLKPSAVHMMLPMFDGTINIEHMTMSSFIGRSDDLNSKYDLIYIGDDVDGFWQKNDGTTDFVDDTMDGKIFFHMGDTMTSGNSDRNNSKLTANFIDGYDTNVARFPGNDITVLKANELKSFMNAGCPVVVSAALFSTARMDTGSNIYKFVTENKYSGVSGSIGVYTNADSSEVMDRIRRNMFTVDFTTLPTAYDETHYLPASGAYARMDFGFNISSEGDYKYKIFVDQNKNGKFEAEEVVRSGNAARTNSVSYSITSERVGLVQWRVEVYKSDNPSIRKSVEGCSAIKCTNTANKKDIKVLQIVPNSGKTEADLTADNYKNLYKNLDAFNVSVDKIKWSDFESYFVGANFRFNMGQAISVENPKSEELDKVLEAGDLEKYDMIVIGFCDSYDMTDLSDTNGAAEFLYYFAMSGKSLLFTHDTTSLYNIKPDATKNVFGYTSNALLRDIMGMNRYGVNSKELNKIHTGLASQLTAYRNNCISNGLLYDTAPANQSQGFTYFALKRIGYKGGNTRVPYRYVVEQAKGGYISANSEAEGGKNGYNVENCLTDQVVRLNVGQVTEYPYNINKTSEILKVAPTHGQWYQLNMEDPEVTVWYTLEDPVAYDVSTSSYKTRSSKDGSAQVYGASPQDAANNYYIFSKGNIFYSGVGHSSTNNTETERKLFVNTMIAAYRATSEPPAVIVTNRDATMTSTNNYSLKVPQEFNYDASDNLTMEDLGSNTVKVTFMPMDYSFSNNIKCRIYHKNSNDFVTTIYDESGHALTADASDYNFIPNLENGKEYYFFYDKSRLATDNEIKFEAQNDRIARARTTTLWILPQPLFQLD